MWEQYTCISPFPATHADAESRTLGLQVHASAVEPTRQWLSASSAVLPVSSLGARRVGNPSAKAGRQVIFPASWYHRFVSLPVDHNAAGASVVRGPVPCTHLFGVFLLMSVFRWRCRETATVQPRARPWAGADPRLARVLKGRNNIAQGNALGTGRPKSLAALKGRNNPDPSHPSTKRRPTLPLKYSHTPL